MNRPESRAAINFFLPSEFTPPGRSFSAPIQDVIPHPPDRRSGCSRHAMSANRARRQVYKALCPPLARLALAKRYVPLWPSQRTVSQVNSILPVALLALATIFSIDVSP